MGSSNKHPEQTLLDAIENREDNKEFISGGRLLPERTLALKLGISRARLRQVLGELEQSGSVFRRQGQGTFVAPPPAADAGRIRILAGRITPRDVMEVRLEIEPALAALAAERASVDELKLLGQLMQATLDARDTTTYETADEIFHYKIAEIAHNPLFLNIYNEIREVRKQASWTQERKSAYSKETIFQLGSQHKDLMENIASRNSEAAASVMRIHLLTVSNTLLRHRHYESS
ncbi:FCD domain-containing protein [Pseudovibrio sp. Ad26]|uniref:FadR/GntR family transcriptional regulator n=1 Tax=Pseudovibrio sp. Ad26 TaxID=989410 RepID=UPI0007AEE15E|nr:FCD domain-containing protein [Pseudovibrio sp. Ad26]KZL09034.1 putative L-lactate dehydrogenase operon regulatory protein [Pseudovibrio sp. Ad26]